MDYLGRAINIKFQTKINGTHVLTFDLIDRFYDCEIVPEETGNIFNDVSNESPSEMKKTNFTFTYGNCVVNFVPQSEVAAHKTSNISTKKSQG